MIAGQRCGCRRPSRDGNSARARDDDVPASAPLASPLPVGISHNDTRTHIPLLIAPYEPI